jgi:predicted regulator of Ras-like GTPase activity (Roadblock/LC7/MglB family)
LNESEHDLKGQARFQRLQQLLLEEDRGVSADLKAEIDRLRAELVSPEEIRRRMGPVLEDKVRYLQEHFPDVFGHVLASTIKQQIRDSQDEMVDALYPIIGKLIRKFVAKEIEYLTERIDQQINDTFSWKSWMRRFKGWFKGESEKDRMIQDLVRAKVEEVFIIDKDSGLLAGSWSRNALADGDMIAGMLTAIKSFVEHAFSKGDQELETIEYESYKIVLNNFHTFYIAVVVSGMVNSEFRLLLTDALLHFAEKHKLKTQDPITGELVEHNSKLLAQHLHDIIDEDQ